MPKYGPCLLDSIRKNGHRHLAEIIFHCGVSLDFFHSEMKLMHTDLKQIDRASRVKPIHKAVNDDRLCDLIVGLLNYNRSKRLTARQMSTHPYVQRYFPESASHPMHPANRQLRGEFVSCPPSW